MENLKIIESNYAKAVKGIKPEWLKGFSEEYYNYIMNLPPQLQITYLITVLHNQVFNGGFHQYFVNGYGQFADETIQALKVIGASNKSKLLQNAMAEVNYEGLPSQDFRKRLLDKKLDRLFIGDELFEPLSKLDDDYERTEDENIERLLSDYLRKNG